MRPRGEALERLGLEPGASVEVVADLAREMSRSQKWPAGLEGLPGMKTMLVTHPLYFSQVLFFNPDPARPLPPLAGKMVEALPPGVERRTLDLLVRAWSGRAGPKDADTLASIIVEASQLRGKRPRGGQSQSFSGATGWSLPAFPTEQVIWNLSGESWAAFYRDSCRISPLKIRANPSDYQKEPEPVSWPQWRPEWPTEKESDLSIWAWEQLKRMNEATAERAAAIAGRMPDPGDRFLFAARCQRKELLTAWCGDGDLLRQVNSSALMEAAGVLGSRAQAPPAEVEATGLMALAREMARRLGVHELDLIQSMTVFREAAPATLKEERQNRLMNPADADVLGLLKEEDYTADGWAQRELRKVPHPLYGIPVCPSVESFRVLTAALGQPLGTWNYRPGSPLQQVVRVFFGGRGGFAPGTRSPELLRALEEFPTSHPMKRQLPRWDALSQSNNAVQESQITEVRPFPDGRPEVVNGLTSALRAMAEEEKAHLSWNLVQAVLEEDPAERKKMLAQVKTRSPLAAGAVEPKSAPVLPTVRTEPPPVPRAGGPVELAKSAKSAKSVESVESEKSVESVDLADLFVKLIADPDVRRQLEPAGALSHWIASSSNNAFLLNLSKVPHKGYQEAAQHLLDARDPLAARMAVILIHRMGQPDLTAAWLLRTLAVFPDDPELLLAFAGLESRREGGKESGEAAFRRGLKGLMSDSSFKPDFRPVWCGIEDDTAGQGADAARIFAAYAEQTPPASLLPSWVAVMEAALEDRRQSARMADPEVRLVALAVVRYKASRRAGQGGPQDWWSWLARLAHNGRTKAAAAVAEALLSQPKGSLGSPDDPAEPAAPWNNPSDPQVTNPSSAGWRWLQLAGWDDPSGLADRLQAVSAAHPDDEQTALAALLARGIIRKLTAEDVKLPALTVAGRHRALAFSSWMLPSARLPDALVLEAWEALAEAEFRDVGKGSRNFLQGNDYLDRLEQAGAGEAVRRLLPALISSVPTIAGGGFPPGYPGRLMRRVQRWGTPAQMEEVLTGQSEYLKTLPEGPASYPMLASALEAQLEYRAGELPTELARRVKEELEFAAKEPPAEDSSRSRNEENPPFPRLALAAAGDLRWHPALRNLLARRPDLTTPGGQSKPWLPLSELFRVLDSGWLVPDVALRLSAGEKGQGNLHWSFLGLMSPPPLPPPDRDLHSYQPPERIALPWETLAVPLAGKFDALVIVEEDGARGDRIVGRIEKLSANGEISLKDLPLTGKLRMLLTEREAPQTIAETLRFSYNTLPLLLDSSRPPGPEAVSPEGWKLLCDPCDLSAATEWQVNRSGNYTDPWPEEVALLLLDAAGQVCGLVSPGERKKVNDRQQPWQVREAPPLKLSLQDFSPGCIMGKIKTSLRVAGPPVRLALARASLVAGGISSAPDNAVPIFTVQESSVTKDPAPAAAVRKEILLSFAMRRKNVAIREPAADGRLEIVRIWHLPTSPWTCDPFSGGSNPALHSSPPQAAWFDGGVLTVLDLDKDTAPRTLDVEIPPFCRLQSMLWTRSKIHLLIEIHPENKQTAPFSRLLSMGADLAGPADPPLDFNELRNLRSLEYCGLPDTAVISSGSQIYGVLTADGKLLKLDQAPESSSKPEQLLPRQALTATSFACEASQARGYESPILDWTDGTLRLSYRKQIPASSLDLRAYHAFTGLPEGMMVDEVSSPPQFWQRLLPFSVLPIGNGLAMGTSDNYLGHSIVLMRMVPGEK